ncbi:thermostable alpha-amylase [Setomelanomma holmii]|uniref:Thermostable alpha-amylase n=1 Tax=Setomelanomma holmii TaxID=210430 RepID=A0A9P4HL89_9PLEO|nr:thermostable alpha-amylase [Setomelanomma holmii]
MYPSTYLPTPPKSPQPEEQSKKPASSKNPIIFQAFEWHSAADHKHWQRLEKALPSLAAVGITHLWLPPGSKARDTQSNGYDIYDAYDLCEFDQKGTIPTKWGTKTDLMSLVTACREQGVGLIWDAILNHRAFADATEDVEVGNADYLMLENIDYTNPEVVAETLSWGKWITQQLGSFADRWCAELRKANGRELLCVGEFWNGDANVLTEWLGNMSPGFKLYDVPLMYRLARLSWGEDRDLRRVFEDTLVQRRPESAVTFIRIHDTQKGQDMDTPICEDFMPHAYSLLLHRRDGTLCVFFGDLYGIAGPCPKPPTCSGKLADLMLARQFDCIGWVRQGDVDHPDGWAIILSWTPESGPNDDPPLLCMDVGRQHAGKMWTDILEFEKNAVEITGDGIGRFVCLLDSMACFVNEAAAGRESFPGNFQSAFQELVE